MTDIRHCAAPGCGKVLVKSVNRSHKEFANQVACSVVCRGILRHLEAAKKRACRHCGGSVTPRKNGRYPSVCNRAACKRDRSEKRMAEIVLDFPKPSGEIVAEFWRHNIDPGDTRGHIPLRPATHVQKQSSIA